MPYLSLGGNDIPVAAGSVTETLEEIGDQGSTFDGSYRSTVRARKSVWSLATPPQTRATADTLEGYLTATQPLTAAGDLLGGTVSVYVFGITRTVTTGVAGAEQVRLSFTMREA